MGINYYVEALSWQMRVHKISAVLTGVFLLLAMMLTMLNIKRMLKRRKRVIICTTLFLVTSMMISESVWAQLPVTEGSDTPIIRDIQIVEGSRINDENCFYPSVLVQVTWSGEDLSGNREVLRIEHSSGNTAEWLELNPGEETGVTQQLQSLGISWISLLTEMDSETCTQGKIMDFLVSEEGSYHFLAAGNSLTFSIGEAPSSYENRSGEPSGVNSETACQDPSLEAKENAASAGGEEDASVPDCTAPEIILDLPLLQGEDGQYFLTEDTVVIRVKEENFDEVWKPSVRTRVKKGYSFSGWKKTKEGAEGILKFSKDGEYVIEFQCRDLAGNKSKKIRTSAFILDTSVPQIKIQGVRDREAYADPVEPSILIQDSTSALASFSCSLTGAKKGAVDVEAVSDLLELEKGISITMNQLPMDSDDVYTLSVQAEDQAGNSTQENLVFSVNQYGSSYILSDETKELVEAYYTEEPVELALAEINASPVVYQIAVSKDGVPQELEEEKDYSVEVRGGYGEWMIYIYRIFASNFEEEGIYHVDITSRDQAANVNNNQAKGTRIDFAVTKSIPTADGEGEEDLEKDNSNTCSDANGIEQSANGTLPSGGEKREEKQTRHKMVGVFLLALVLLLTGAALQFCLRQKNKSNKKTL